MVAELPGEKLEELVELLQDRFAETCTISHQDYQRIAHLRPKKRPRNSLPPISTSDQSFGHSDESLRMLELEAEALELIFQFKEDAA